MAWYDLKEKIGRVRTNHEKHHKVRKEAGRKAQKENEFYFMWATVDGFRVKTFSDNLHLNPHLHYIAMQPKASYLVLFKPSFSN